MSWQAYYALAIWITAAGIGAVIEAAGTHNKSARQPSIAFLLVLSGSVLWPVVWIVAIYAVARRVAAVRSVARDSR